MIGQELRKVLEDSALRWFLDIHLHAEQSFFPHLVEELIHHLQRVQITIFVELRARKDALEPAQDALQNMHGVRYQERSRRCPDDDQHLGWLDEHFNVALFHQESADNCAKNQENPYDREHYDLSGASVMWLPPAWMLTNIASFARSNTCGNISVFAACAAPMLTVSDRRSPHRRKSEVLRGQPVLVRVTQAIRPM